MALCFETRFKRGVALDRALDPHGEKPSFTTRRPSGPGQRLKRAGKCVRSMMWFFKVAKPARRCTEDWSANERTIDRRPAVLPRGPGVACMRRLQLHRDERPNPFRWAQACSAQFLRHLRQLSNDWQMPARVAVSRPYRRRFREVDRCPGEHSRFRFRSGLGELI